jgi:hypothetical protein
MWQPAYDEMARVWSIRNEGWNLRGSWKTYEEALKAAEELNKNDLS